MTIERGYYNFRPFEVIDRFTNNIIKTFFYDVGFSNENTQIEKKKHNFSSRYYQETKQGNTSVLIYDISGIDPNDVNVTKVVEDGTTYIIVEGSSKNDILDVDMNIKARWAIPFKQFKKPTKKIENGFLYVFIEPITEKEEIETI